MVEFGSVTDQRRQNRMNLPPVVCLMIKKVRKDVAKWLLELLSRCVAVFERLREGPIAIAANDIADALILPMTSPS